MKKALRLWTVLICLCGLTLSTLAFSAEMPFSFGLLLVGPYNDRGYSQAHYEGGKYAEKTIPGVKMIYIDKVNPADRPGVTIPQLVDDMVEKGAKLVIANSDDMKDGIREAAVHHPDIHFLHVSGDDVLTGKAPKNLSNLFGKMEYGKMMAGFAAAMMSKTGKIGYVGPLINEETRRLSVSCYLGARYAWETVLKKKPEDLKFQVTWIGFWFNIPGVTADPTQVVQNFFNTGCDVVVSGIDTTEAIVVARQKRQEGKEVWAVPYDYVGACEGASEACLGVPLFQLGTRIHPAHPNVSFRKLEIRMDMAGTGLEKSQQFRHQHHRIPIGFSPFSCSQAGPRWVYRGSRFRQDQSVQRAIELPGWLCLPQT
jgi:simple sugar transport system substrate-binding protein